MEKKENILRFLLAVIDKKLVVLNVSQKKIIETLAEEKYKKYPKTRKRQVEVEEDEDKDEEDDKDDNGYDYLLTQNFKNATLEKVNRLRREIEKMQEEYKILEAMPIKEIWKRELDEFLVGLDKFEKERIKYWSSFDKDVKKKRVKLLKRSR